MCRTCLWEDKIKNKILSLFEEALQKRSIQGIDHLFLSALLRSKRGISLYEGKVDAVEIADEIKIGVWLGIQGHWGCSSLEQVTEPALNLAIQQARQASQFSDPDPDYSLASTKATPTPHQPDDSILKLTMEDLERISHQMENQAKNASPLIHNIPEVGMGYDSLTRIIANSQGIRIIEQNHLLKAGLSVMAAGNDGRNVNVHEMDYGTEKNHFKPEEIVSEVTQEVISRVSPRSVPSGKWPILFDPRSAAQLLATFWSIYSGDLLYRKLTRLEEKLGQQIASPLLSITQTGMDGLVPHVFDAEGSPVQTKNIIQEGRFETFLHNRYTAKRAKTETTGNAAGGLGDTPGVTPANLRIDGQLTATQDLVSSLSRGILVKELHGASSSPISGDFSYGTLGYWIENGKIQYPVADFTIAGNFFDLIKKIQGIGDDLRYFMPHALGSYGGRSLLVQELAVSGS